MNLNLKAGDCVDIRTATKNVIEHNGGIAKSADFVAAGIRAVDVVNLCNAGFLNRVRHGYYQLAEQDEASEEQILAKLIPKALFVSNRRCSIMDIATSPRANGLSPSRVPHPDRHLM